MNRPLRYVGGVGGVGAIYWLAAKAGLQLAYLHGSVAALWAPCGRGDGPIDPLPPPALAWDRVGGPCGGRFLAATWHGARANDR